MHVAVSLMNECSVKLVEQELWQREEKGLIGILPVRDAAAEIQPAGPVISHGNKLISSLFKKKNNNKKVFLIFIFMFLSLVGKGTDSLDQNSKVQGGSSDSQKLDVKNQHDVVHWHNR